MRHHWPQISPSLAGPVLQSDTTLLGMTGVSLPNGISFCPADLAGCTSVTDTYTDGSSGAMVTSVAVGSIITFSNDAYLVWMDVRNLPYVIFASGILVGSRARVNSKASLMCYCYATMPLISDWPQCAITGSDWRRLVCVIADFNLTDELKAAVDEAKRRCEAATSKLDIDYIIYDKFGREHIKQNKLSPDSFMHLALQVCYCNCESSLSWLLVIIISSIVLVYFTSSESVCFCSC